MLQRYPQVIALIGGYVQNHAVEAGSSSPLRIASERDSVIELYFEDEAQLSALVQQPDYLGVIRPDEARFNALNDNAMVKTRENVLFSTNVVGRCKRFDFFVRKPGTLKERFLELMAKDGHRLALDPTFTGSIDRLVDNLALDPGADVGFGTGSIDMVREYWATSFDHLGAVSMSHKSGLPIDLDSSFSVFATEFVMKSTG